MSRFEIRRLWPRWMLLYVATVCVATLTPLWRSCPSQEFRWAVLPADVSLNLLLFVPLGIALRGQRIWRVAAIATVASLCIESLQTELPRRANAVDVIANLAGALGGRLAPHVRMRLERGPGPALQARIALAAAVVAVGAVALATSRLTPNRIAGWEPFDLVIGNERTGDRPWEGRLAELAIYDRALEGDPDPAESSLAMPPAWADSGPVLWLRFATPRAGRIDGPGGSWRWTPPAQPPDGFAYASDGLVAQGGAWVLPRRMADAVREAITASGGLTLTASLAVARRDAVGPTRIVSLSNDAQHRNFTLAQFDAGLELRVRTPNTGDNGIEGTVRTQGDELGSELLPVRASFAGPTGRIDVGGRCAGSQLYALGHAPWPLAGGLALTLLGVFALAAFAGGAQLSRSRFGRRTVVAAASAGAGIAWALLFALRSWSHLPDYDFIALGLALLAVASVRPLLGARGERLSSSAGARAE